MDELRFKSLMTAPRSARRLALLAALNCSAIIGSGFAPISQKCAAAEITAQQTASGLRSLLTDGWQQPAPLSARPTKITTLTDVVVEALDSQPSLPERSLTQPEAQEKKNQAEFVPSPSPASTNVSQLVPIKIDKARQLIGFPIDLPAGSLHSADISARTVASKSSRNTDTSTSSEALPKLPAPVHEPPALPAFTMPGVTMPGVTTPSVLERPTRTAAKAKDTARVQRDRVQRNQGGDFLDDSMDDLRTRALRSLAAKQGFGLLGSGMSSRERDTAATSPGQSVLTSPSVLNPPRKAAAKPVAIEPLTINATPSASESSIQIGSTIRANKLGEIAAEQIRDARSRLQRGATHSAKRLTIQAIQNLVAIQDVRQGNNENARHLDVALTAIRESADFGAKFGTLDQRSLGRLVVAHKTRVLKDKDLSLVSPMRATEAYLAVAREEIVMATASVAMASDALVLLGQIESSIAPASDTRSGAVALSLQQAAVEVDPANSDAWLQLGTTMLNEGLTEESIAVLSRSVHLQPSRKGYQRLMAAAQRAQDVSLMQQCRLALQNPHLKLQIPVRQLNQETFAAMYKPTNSIARNSAAAKQQSESEKSKTEAQPVSGKPKRFALLRSWVMPKSFKTR